jgi:ribosomal protein S4E
MGIVDMAKRSNPMKNPKDNPPAKLRDGAQCKVIGGAHAGKAGVVRDINLSKSGFVTITVVQSSGDRFKTLAKNVVIP